MEDREKVTELYMHNFILRDLNFWDPNSRLGDIQLMELTSWLTHEEARVEEVKKVMTEEEKEPLYIRVELISLKAVINNHNLIASDPSLAHRYITTEEQGINNFDDTFRMLGIEGLQAC